MTKKKKKRGRVPRSAEIRIIIFISLTCMNIISRHCTQLETTLIISNLRLLLPFNIVYLEPYNQYK